MSKVELGTPDYKLIRAPVGNQEKLFKLEKTPWGWGLKFHRYFSIFPTNSFALRYLTTIDQ
jgi:hypothetical protein